MKKILAVLASLSMSACYAGDGGDNAQLLMKEVVDAVVVMQYQRNTGRLEELLERKPSIPQLYKNHILEQAALTPNLHIFRMALSHGAEYDYDKLVYDIRAKQASFMPWSDELHYSNKLIQIIEFREQQKQN